MIHLSPFLLLSLSISLSLSLCHSEIIANIETTLSTAQQTKTIHTTPSPPKKNGGNKKSINNSKLTALKHSAKANGGLIHFYLPNVRPRFCCNMSNQRTRKKQISRAGFFTYMYLMYRHWETIKFINII